MEIGVKVVAEHYETGKRRHILSAYFTFIALDQDKVPCEVAQVVPKTPIEKRRYEEANDRRERRKKKRKSGRSSGKSSLPDVAEPSHDISYILRIFF